MPRRSPEFGTREFEEPEEEKQIEKLRDFVKEITEKLREEEVPVTEDCRIDMEAFKGVYSPEEIRHDLKIVEGWEQEEFYKGLSKEEIKEERIKKEGEQLEMLKTSIFYKFLGKEFITARASPFDDLKNKVDNVILEKETGNLVCALDEEKKEKILERNRRKAGGKLKYGFWQEKDKLVLGEAENIPLFYLALPSRHIKKGIENLIPSSKEKSDYEEKLFSYFTSSISSQIGELKFKKLVLSSAFKKNLNRFEKSLEKFKGRKNY